MTLALSRDTNKQLWRLENVSLMRKEKQKRNDTSRPGILTFYWRIGTDSLRRGISLFLTFEANVFGDDVRKVRVTAERSSRGLRCYRVEHAYPSETRILCIWCEFRFIVWYHLFVSSFSFVYDLYCVCCALHAKLSSIFVRTHIYTCIFTVNKKRNECASIILFGVNFHEEVKILPKLFVATHVVSLSIFTLRQYFSPPQVKLYSTKRRWVVRNTVFIHRISSLAICI